MILGELPLRLSSARLTDETRFTHFRLVQQSDAQFICDLRANPRLNSYLSASSPDVRKQEYWIEVYKEREASGTEFYFIIVCDGVDYGVLRMYDFRLSDDQDSFCWGSWVLHPSRPSGLAVYSALCVYELGFSVFRFDHCHFDVRKENIKVIEFHKRAGATIEDCDSTNYFFGYLPSAYARFRDQSADQIAKFEGCSPAFVSDKGE